MGRQAVTGTAHNKLPLHPSGAPRATLLPCGWPCDPQWPVCRGSHASRVQADTLGAGSSPCFLLSATATGSVPDAGCPVSLTRRHRAKPQLARLGHVEWEERTLLSH